MALEGVKVLLLYVLMEIKGQDCRARAKCLVTKHCLIIQALYIFRVKALSSGVDLFCLALSVIQRTLMIDRVGGIAIYRDPVSVRT